MKMDIFRSAIVVAHTNWHSCKKDYRIYLILVFVAILIINSMKGYVAYGIAENKDMTFCVLPLLFQSADISLRSCKILIYIGFILLICDAPFITGRTSYIVMRSGRNAWWLGECIFLFEMSVAYMLFVTVLSSLCTLPVVTFANDWGDVLYDFIFGTDTNTMQELLERFPLEIGEPEQVITLLYPFFSQIYVFVTGVFVFFWLALLIYLVNLKSSEFKWGLVVSGLFVFLDPVLTYLSKPANYKLRLFSPVCWTSLECNQVLSKRYAVNMGFVAVFLGITICAFVVLIAVISKKISLYCKE
jgi:hypothetical protein